MAALEKIERVFKTAWFVKAARKARLTDAELCAADDDELEDFRKLAKSYSKLNDDQLAALLKDKDLQEICHGG